jgi:hypothetical protein
MLNRADVNANWVHWKTHASRNHVSTVANARQLITSTTNVNVPLVSRVRPANWTLVSVNCNNHAVNHLIHAVNRSDWVPLFNMFAFVNKKLPTVSVANKLNETHAKASMDRNHCRSAIKVSSCATVNVCSLNHAQVAPFGMTKTRLVSGPICKVSLAVLNEINHPFKDTVNNNNNCHVCH